MDYKYYNLIDKYNASSVQYAISIDDKIITSDNVGVYSKSENRILMNDNMYGIGSVSKMYVTTAVMQLVEYIQMQKICVGLLML